jgi:hypothetical protein
MSSNPDPLAGIPLTTQDLVSQIDTESQAMQVQLNAAQSAHIQDLLRTGKVTPQQVEDWKRRNKKMPDVLPATVSVTGTGGRTQPDAAFQNAATVRSFELTDAQKANAAHAMSDAASTISPGATPAHTFGRTQTLNVGSTASNISENVG